MIYPDFEMLLVPEDNGMQNPEESHTNKYHIHVACGYGYKLVCVDDKYSKPFKSYLGQDTVYNSINTIIEETKYCTDMIKKPFSTELMMTNEETEDLENSIKCWICDNVYVVGDSHLIMQ